MHPADIFNPAQALGGLALAFGVACFSQHDDRRFKIFMALECLSYALHFMLLGESTAVASSLISLGRSVASLRSRSPWLAATFIAMSLAMGLWLYDGWWSLLPIAASCIGTAALFFLQGLQMRLLMLSGTLLWLLNNLWMGSIGGTLLEAVIALTNARTILQLWRCQRLKAPT